MQNFSHSSSHNDSSIHTDGLHNALNPTEGNIWKLLLITALAYIIWSDKLSINLIYGEPTTTEAQDGNGRGVKAGLFSFEPERKKKKQPEIKVELPPNALNNITFAIDPAFGERNHVAPEEKEVRLEKCQEYIKRFAPVSIAEMRKFGIPASVTLAQGLLESNAGESKLARTSNNHFGIKCFSKRCGKGHCVNFTDDSHKDFFIKYTNTWGSYRAHSQFLKNTGRYQQLFELSKSDYRGWAKGLVRSGYATDKRYGDKLIAIIQSLGLDRFDKMQ